MLFRSKVAKQAAERVKKVSNPVEREALLERLEKLLGASVQSLGELMDGRPRSVATEPMPRAPQREWQNRRSQAKQQPRNGEAQ